MLTSAAFLTNSGIPEIALHWHSLNIKALTLFLDISQGWKHLRRGGGCQLHSTITVSLLIYTFNQTERQSTTNWFPRQPTRSSRNRLNKTRTELPSETVLNVSTFSTGRFQHEIKALNFMAQIICFEWDMQIKAVLWQRLLEIFFSSNHHQITWNINNLFCTKTSRIGRKHHLFPHAQIRRWFTFAYWIY